MNEMLGEMKVLRDAMTGLEARRAQLEQDMNELRPRLAASAETAPAKTIPTPPPSVEQSAKSVETPAPLSIRIG